MKYFYPVIIILLTLSACTTKSGVRRDLDQGWTVMQVKEGADQQELITYASEVPSCVHLDLLNAGAIEDPFYGDNESKQQWIGEQKWEYNLSFELDETLLGMENVEIVFEGLDTYAEVSLNGTTIINADNMFRSWEADVKELLHQGSNTISVLFFPPGEINEEKAAKLPYKLPDNRVFTRKSPYHFGWDWGPEFVTCGIWKPVYLHAWNSLRIGNMHVEYASIDENPLPLKVHVDVFSDRDQTAKLRLFDDASKDRIAFEKVKLKTGLNKLVLDTEINDPHLWWPVGLGEQALYSVRASISDRETTDERSIHFGIRQIELVKEDDEYGETFYFVVNGLPVFMKGANYVPQDNFLTRVDTARYEKLIESVIEANMNTLRVWGGGFYENDLFYDLCDKHGILVWQDFMFACAMYPGDTAFIDNVREEAIENVSRLSNHPSIALWCGNNEIDEGWHNWGWQDQLEYSAEDSTKIWHDYLHVFHEILPEVVEAVDPGTIYHASSPMTGWGREEAYEKGDVHYWGVWWGEEPFEMYREKTGRFVSEYGFQGIPGMETLLSFGGSSKHQGSDVYIPDSNILGAHQKHPRGTQLIHTYMEREFIVPEKFEDYIYVSQILQAEGMGQGFYTHRISQPYCMGTLYWQLNDCWPVTSWSGLDYYGRWKALHYHVKRAFSPLMIRTIQDDNGLHVFALNDEVNGHELELKCSLLTFTGDTLLSHTEAIFLPPQSNQRVFFSPEVPAIPANKVFVAELRDKGLMISKSFHYFVATKDMLLEDPGLEYEIIESEAGLLLQLRAGKLARQVFLDTQGIDGRFEDNFFDMAAGEERTTKFSGPATMNELKEKLKIKTIYETL